MINYLNIENILLIKKQEITFSKGFCVLTGETGAGKSIILNSITFLLGKKTKSDKKNLLSFGAQKGQVCGSFDISQNDFVKDLLNQNEIEHNGGELILKRIIFDNTKDKCFANDILISSRLLSEIGDFLIELSRQNEQSFLLMPKYHLDILDKYANSEPHLSVLYQKYAKLISIKKTLEEAETEAKKVADEIEFIEHSISELSKHNFQDAEEAELSNRKIELSKQEKQATSIREIKAKLFANNNIKNTIFTASRQASDLNPELSTTLENILSELDRAEDILDITLRDSTYSERELEEIAERLFLLKDMSRKYKINGNEIGTFLETQKNRLEKIEQNNSQIIKLKAQEKESLKEYILEAQKLSILRQKVAKQLEEEVKSNFSELNMQGADFIVEFRNTSPSQKGTDLVEFKVKTNPGMPFGELSKTASGGELSRLMLAIKSTIISTSQVKSIIFDEIDSGIGGATANSVAQKIKYLSTKIQVILITHQAQIAALADEHLKIEKIINFETQNTQTTVHQVTGQKREEEIARMLGGNLSDENILAARNMLNSL